MSNVYQEIHRWQRVQEKAEDLLEKTARTLRDIWDQLCILRLNQSADRFPDRITAIYKQPRIPSGEDQLVISGKNRYGDMVECRIPLYFIDLSDEDRVEYAIIIKGEI
jgi:hypothetical protein